MRSERLALALLLCGTSASAAGQTLGEAQLRKVDEVFAAYDRSDEPGCVLGIYRDGRIAYARGYGMANLELGIALSPQSFLDIGSTSKQFTAFAIGLLERDGELRRSDPVRKFLPELGGYADAISVEQMIEHTSGLRDYLELMALAGSRSEDWTDGDDALHLIVRQRAANFPPDSEYLYSNTGYFLLSQIVERVSGKTLRAFAEERIFAPLGMRGTHFHDDHAMVVPHRATAYRPRAKGGFAIDMSDYEQTGDGAVLTSVLELLHWDRNFSTGKVGGMDLVRRQQVPGTLADGSRIEYASGLVVSSFRGQPTLRHGGSWAGYRAELLRFPKQHTSFAVLCNRGDADPSAMADEVAEVVLAGVLDAPDLPVAGAAIELPREVLAKRAGVWRSRTTGADRVIELVGSQLTLDVGEDLPLVPLSADRFSLVDGISIRFDTEHGKPVMILEQPGTGDDSYDLLPAFGPGAIELAEFEGAYHALELDVTWQVRADATGLRAEIRGRELAQLTPTSPDAFVATSGILSGSSLRFQRDPNGQLIGFTVQAGRVRNVAFTRVP
jgi:CubicO group peptidase (beta-lactamase class C family)